MLPLHLLQPLALSTQFDCSLRPFQFSAVLGDLVHKQDVYLQKQTFNSTASCHFANSVQARYLLDRYPQLIPGCPWNTHSLGTWFEHLYYSDISFRLSYLIDLPNVTCDS